MPRLKLILVSKTGPWCRLYRPSERTAMGFKSWILIALQWCHNGLDGVSNHPPHHCLLSRLFGRRSKKTSKLRVTGLCVGNSPGTGEFPTQMASNAENVSIWWRHQGLEILLFDSGLILAHICPPRWPIALGVRQMDLTEGPLPSSRH